MNKIEFEDKDYLSKDKLIDLSDIDTIYMPLVVNFSTDVEILVKKGKKIKKNDPIAIKKDLDFSIVSPVNGIINDISECVYLDGRTVKCVVIEKKGRQPKEEMVEDINAYTKEEYLELLKKYGVTSMGGGNFPTYIKYEPILKTLIVNAVECEPYITSDYVLAKEYFKEIIETINAIISINKLRECFIAINEKYSDLLSIYSNNTINYSKIHIVSVKDFYPIGWEKTLIKEITKESYDKLPQEKGIVVNNISTIYSIYKALKYNTCIDNRFVTISGERVKEPTNALLRIGTNLKDVLPNIELIAGDTIKYVSGGPMMGRALPKNDLIVTQNLNGILFLDDIEDKKVYPCFRCGKCVEMCPANIVPVLIKDKVNNPEALKKLNPEKCIECGMCSFICPSNIDVRSFVKKAKRSK